MDAVLYFPVKNSNAFFHTFQLSATSESSASRLWDSFSLTDIKTGRVRYVHNGAESTRDAIELVLKFVASSGFRLPPYLQVEGASFFCFFIKSAFASTTCLKEDSGSMAINTSFLSVTHTPNNVACLARTLSREFLTNTLFERAKR